MDFTEIYEQSRNLVYFSPGAHFILNALDDVLIVRRADTLLITHTWTISHPSETASILSSSRPQLPATASSHQWISHAGWSCDSEYIFAASVKRGIVHVFKLRDEEWNARIETGAEGLTKAEWAPDGRHILCFSEWGVSLLLSMTTPLSLHMRQLRVTIWSLVTGAATYIQFPIHPDRGACSKLYISFPDSSAVGYAFRGDARYFVLAERHKSKDTLGIYDASNSYRLVRVRICPYFHGKADNRVELCSTFHCQQQIYPPLPSLRLVTILQSGRAF